MVGIQQSQMLKDASLEITGKDRAELQSAGDTIPKGTKINVTYLGNEDLEMRVAAARAVKELGFVPVPHISARRVKSHADLTEFLDRLAEVDAIEHVFAVGGDPASPQGPFADSLELIESGIFSEYAVKEVNVAGYPEGHPDIETDELWQFLENKQRALKEQGLKSCILTQFGFDADPMVDWVRQVRSRGIDAQIRLGVPGPTNIKRLLLFAKRFGISANAMVVKKYGFSLGNLVGSAGPEKLIQTLESEKQADPGLGQMDLHFYTFGGVEATAKWLQSRVGSDS